ncbi:metalloprotease PmbA [Wenzhouxiangella sp. AB-CW3]|uniref:metalloprotease PmbA n=1 Tax=Wenzhouxiangella sp. AB-CW3 TaxID=2771012 RepID=UPI00168B738D|nr:metalloprotease PmbA [Wenzhouxiangella sp. AB-CW3]QOC22095.1 metalloprotease PmbA [Wenzhouxiangella sp. AB-CW3]
MSNSELKGSGINALLHDPDREIDLLIDIATRVIDQARAGGADQAEVSINSSLAREAGVRMGEIETLEEARDRGVRVTVYRQQCAGSASTGDLRADVIDETVERALAIARHTQPDRDAGLADAALMATDITDLDLWHPADLGLDVLAERAREIEAVGRDADTRIANTEGASVSTEAGVAVYANSHGFVASSRGTRFSQSCVLIARDEAGMQRDFDYDTARAFGELAAPEVTGREAARRTLRRLGSKRIPTGRVPVLFSPETARGLIGHLVAAASGSNLYRRSSYLLDAAGQSVMPDWASLVERPRLPSAARSSCFDGDGVATRESALVDAGVLKRYVLGSYSARRLGLKTTANAGGVRNLELVGGASTQEQLIQDMERGLVVTELMGQGVNLVTGDYSRGAAGFWVENGEIAWPVEEITIAGHLRDMLGNLRAAGTDIDPRHNIRTGSLLLDEMTVAGQGDD